MTEPVPGDGDPSGEGEGLTRTGGADEVAARAAEAIAADAMARARPFLPPPPPVFAPPPPPRFVGVAATTGAAVPAAIRPPLPEPTAETLSIPLGPRRLVGRALDLLTRSDAGLRSASFYIGLMLLATLGPVAVLLGVAMANGDATAFATDSSPDRAAPAWVLWMVLGFLPAGLGFLASGVEARALATAIIGGRAEGRPLLLRESIAVARSRFWQVLGAQLLVGILSGAVEIGLTLVLSAIIGRVDALSYAVSVAVGVVVGTPFIYTPAGIVLGEADTIEALRRSVRLARARKQLAIVVTLFSVLSGLIVQFGLGIAIDTVSRVLSGAGLTQHFPPVLVVPLAAALVFSYGTLVLLTEAIAAAPAVHAFVALTHYTAGLERGRREPVRLEHPGDPWLTPGLVTLAVVGLISLVLGVVTMPWGVGG